MTHSYSTNSAERRYIPFFIAAVAIGSTFVAFNFLDRYRIEPPWWASPPIDTMAFYGLAFWLFDRFIWKWRPLRWLRITIVPDVSGEWRGRVRPAPTAGVSAGMVEEIDIELSIRQTCSELLVTGRTQNSKSRSLSGSFVVADEYSLGYEYLNEPSAPAPATMHTHHGVARLTANPDCTVLEGEYFSGRDRQNIGTIRVMRVPR